MAIDNLAWLKEDNRDRLALTRYILFRCCKKAKKQYKLGQDIEGWERSIMTEYLPIDFMDFKWIVDRCNFKMAKFYGVDFLCNSFVHWYEEAHFVPEYFDADFTCDYKKMKNGKWKKIKTNWVEEDFVSGAEICVAKKIIRRWKLYGRWFVKIDNWYWGLKYKIKKYLKKDQ